MYDLCRVFVYRELIPEQFPTLHILNRSESTPSLASSPNQSVRFEWGIASGQIKRKQPRFLKLKLIRRRGSALHCTKTRWDDGILDDVNIETLQPPEWIASHHVKVGSSVLLPLDLLEMGLPETMQAKVLSVEPCPPIATGLGRVVLTTINHLNRDVCELTVEDKDGRQRRCAPTGLHRFYREGDNQWAHLNELKQGDLIRGRMDSLKVIGIEKVPGVHRVFNMTVEGEHLYQVSALWCVCPQ